MSYTTLLASLENGIYTITINRPDKLNALNRDVFTDLNLALDEIAANPDIKSVIITGAGPKAFVAGADISEFNALDKNQAMALAKMRSTDLGFFTVDANAACCIPSEEINEAANASICLI